MLSTLAPVVAALSTGHKLGLALVGVAFIVFALVSSFVLPARVPDFPGKHIKSFSAVAVLFFVGMLAAVLIFGKEAPPAESAGKAATTPTQTAPAPSTAPSTSTSTAPTPSAAGDAAAGKAVFASAGCGGCHTLKAAGTNGTVGPDLDQLKPPEAVIVHQVEVGGGPMPAFKGQLSQKQIQDVAAYVFASTH
jgi:mono/diheme cytochrome c family protein